MLVELTPKYDEYEQHKGERYETDGKTYVVGGEEVYYLKGLGAYAKDGLRELGVVSVSELTYERAKQLYTPYDEDQMRHLCALRDVEIDRLLVENAKLHELVQGLWFAAQYLGMNPDGATGSSFARQMRELGIEVD